MLRHIGDLARSGMPVAVVDDRGRRPGIPYVGTTNRDGMREATAHLTGHGRRRVAFIGGQMDSAFAQARFEDYLDALRAAGLPCVPELVALPERTEPTSDEIAAVLAAEPDAVVCAWDDIAFAVLSQLHIAGRRVPDDIAVVGFDDGPVARASFPPLTTVHQPFRRMGRAAVRILLDALERGDVPANASVPTQLVVRESCGTHA
ncbi:LacI family DNA-binding transcriptional regulator [Streptomyces sp. NPDC003247]|uniref:LacI family DNA-binding transcriptional regulator n=1 Tax=Streptomyces sp. NPDC003247 TaxID=3364677 RepID=UPI0036BFBB10